MASGIDGKARADTQGSGKYLNFPEFVDFQLQKARQQIRTADVLMAGTLATVLVLAYLLVFLVCDQWVFPRGLPTWLRWVGLVAWLSMLGSWVGWRMMVPMARRVNSLFAAREVERAEPELRSNLLNWVDLQEAGRQVDPAVLKAIERQAAVQLSRIDVAQAVDHRPLLRSGYALVAVVILFCAYAILSPKSMSASLVRVLPFTDAPPPTRTQIREVRPGDIRMSAKSPLEVTADLAGVIPDKVELVYTTADRKFVDERLRMQTEGVAGTRFLTIIPGHELQQSITYRVEGGDAISPTYSVTVEQPPSARVERGEVTPPSYTDLTPELVTGGNITGWEGSTVRIDGAFNRPVKTAIVEFLEEPTSAPTGEQVIVTLRADGQGFSATWPLEMRSDGSFARHYRVQGKTADGHVDPQPVVYEISIRRDDAPQIVLLSPERDLQVPANAVIPLLAEAVDPDFLLGPVTLEVEQSGKVISRETLSQGKLKSVRLQHDLLLAPLGLKTGDEVSFSLEAQDNRQPKRNRKRTPPLKIRIEPPTEDRAVQEQLARDKARQQEQFADNDTTQRREDMAPGDRESREGEGQAQPPREGGDNRPMGDPREPPTSSGDSGSSTTSDKPSNADQGGNNGQAGSSAGRSSQPSETSGDGGADKAPLRTDGEDDQEALERLLQRQAQQNQSARPEKTEPSGGSRGENPSEGKQERQPPGDTPKSSPPPADSPQTTGSEPKTPGETKAGQDDKSMPSGTSGAKPPTSQAAGGNETSSDKPENQGASTKPEGPSSPKSTGEAAKDQQGTNQPAAGPNPSPKPAGEAGQPNKMTDEGSPSGGRETPKVKEGEPGSTDSESGSTKAKPEGSSTKNNENQPGSSQEPGKAGEATNGKGKEGPAPGNQKPEKPDSSTTDPKSADSSDASGNRSMNPAEDKSGKPTGENSKEEGNRATKGGQPKESSENTDGRSPSTPAGQSGSDSPSPSMNKGGEAPKAGPGKNPPPAGDESNPGPGRSKGQRSEQPQTGENGSSAPASQGQKGDQGAPTGEMTKRPGESPSSSGTSESQSGKSQPSESLGSKGQPGSSGKEGTPKSDGTGSNQPGQPDESGKPDSAQPGMEKRETGESRPSERGTPQDPNNPAGASKPSGDKTAGSQPSSTKDKGDGGQPGTSPPKAGKGDADPAGDTAQKPAGEDSGRDGPGKDGQGREKSMTKPASENKGEQSPAGGDQPGGEKGSPSGAEKPASEKSTNGKSTTGKTGSGKPDQQPSTNDDSTSSSGKQGGSQSPKEGMEPSGSPEQGGAENGKESGKPQGGQESGSAQGGNQPGSPQGGKQPGKPGSDGEPGASGTGDSSTPSNTLGDGGNPSQAMNSGSGGRAGNPGAGNAAGSADSGPGSAAPAGEAANLDHKKQAADLVLKQLKEGLSRGDVDQETLDELGWTPDQLKAFVERMQSAMDAANGTAETPADQARRVQFEEMLKSLNVDRQSTRRTGSDQPGREVDQIDARRAPVPVQYRQAWERYTKTLSRAPASGTKKPASK